MTLRETKMGLAVIKAAYHEFCRDMDIEETDAVAKLWHDCLGRYNYELYSKAIKYHICNEKFAPRISEVIGHMHRINPDSKFTLEEHQEQHRRMQRLLDSIKQEELPTQVIAALPEPSYES